MSPVVETVVSTYEASLEQQIATYKSALEFQGQNPTRKQSKEALLNAHSRNLVLLREILKRPSVRELILPPAYAPCAARLSDLQKISVEDLRVETHHRGCFITARTITAPYLSTKIITIIEEDNEIVAKLELCFQDASLPDFNLPINSTVAVKEPYLKFNGEGDCVIRVDHPSDIAILRGDEPVVAMMMEVVSKAKTITSLEWKDAGDRAYLDKSYSSAVECYTQALDTAPKSDQVFIRDLRRKRAYANLTAKHFDAVLEDALASCCGDSSDSKAYYCAGRASYEVGLFEESKTHFERALELNPKDSKSRKDYNRAIMRIGEKENGKYDFSTLVGSVTPNHVHLDCADFIKNTSVGTTATHGRGLFATKYIQAGGLVLVEKALCLPNLYERDRAPDTVLYNFNTNARTKRSAQPALFLQLAHNLYNNPNLATRFFDLDSGNYLRSGEEGELIDGVPIIDIFLVEAIRLRNCFSCPRRSQDLLRKDFTSPKPDLSTGLWTRAAYINHSCVPNCARSFIGDMMVVRATCNIPAGTEITHQYAAPEALFKTRQSYFRESWDFDCDCRLCEGEKKSPDSSHQRRRDLVNKIKGDVLKSTSRINDANIRNIERLTKKLEDLHEPEVYGTLPRLLLIHPSIWLTDAYRSKGNPEKTIKYALQILRNFGFIDQAKGETLQFDGSMGITNSESFNALRYASEAYKAVGKVGLARQCNDAAREMYAVLSGSSVGIDAVLEPSE